MMDVSVVIRRASARFADRGPGRATWHAFSFGPHYDPEHLGFGPMVCHDEHLLAAGQGFAAHRHAGLEIVSWVLSGALRHTDPSGSSTVPAGSAGLFSPGAGGEHSEIAAAPQTRFVQVWLDAVPDGEPSYEVRTPSLTTGAFAEVARPVEGSMFRVARLEANESVTLPPAARQHLFVGSGGLLRSSLAEPLAQGDAFLLTGEDEVTVAAAVPSELLLWTFAD